MQLPKQITRDFLLVFHTNVLSFIISEIEQDIGLKGLTEIAEVNINGR